MPFCGREALYRRDIAALFGEQPLFDNPPAPPSAPLPATPGGVEALVNGEAAPLYSVSYFPINFRAPVDSPAGTAAVEVKRGDGTASKLGSVGIVPRGPRLLTLDGTSGAIVNQDFSFPMPAGTFGDLADSSRPENPTH